MLLKKKNMKYATVRDGSKDIFVKKEKSYPFYQVCRPCFSLTGLDGNLKGLDTLACIIEKGL